MIARYLVSRLYIIKRAIGRGLYSLHDRRSMSQAGRTRYFARSATRARSARRGKEKNKALFFSFPRLALRAHVALRAKYRVRSAWLIKRLSCRLINDLRVLGKTLTHALIFAAPCWIAVAMGNIYMKTSQEQK